VALWEVGLEHAFAAGCGWGTCSPPRAVAGLRTGSEASAAWKRFRADGTRTDNPAHSTGRVRMHYGGGVEQDELKSVVTRLARPRAAGGYVVERAAIVAAGADSEAVMSWIVAHGGTAEEAVETSVRHGLHGSRQHAGGESRSRSPSRFVLPAGALE
jgi:hypothetical protein